MRRGSMRWVAVSLMVVAAGWGAPSAATPIVRFDATAHAAISTTGNTLGLAGNGGHPSDNDGIGAFIDATGTLQLSGWPVGTTDQWSLASSDAELDLPSGASVLYAELVWGGSVNSGVVGATDGPVTLRAPSGAVHAVAPDAATVPEPGSSLEDGNFYARSANVTALIEGPGRYRVGAVPATLASSDAAAGWSLMVVYTAPGVRLRRVGVLTIMEEIGGSNGASAIGLAGLCTPTADQREARIAITAMDGDANINDDTFRFAGSEQGTYSQSARIAGPGRPLNNVFGSAITGEDGAIDTRGSFGDANHDVESNVSGARQGWDIAHIDASNALTPSQPAAWFRGATGSDTHSLLAVAVQLSIRAAVLGGTATVNPAAPSVGDTVQVTLSLSNTGDRGATAPLLRVPGLPSGVAYVPGSLRVDGALPPGGAVNAATALADGVELPDLGAGNSMTVTFQLVLGGVPPGGTVTIAPRVDFAQATCNGAAPADSFVPPAIVMSVARCGDGVIAGSEACDDGDTAPADGCDATCHVERGWTCVGAAGATSQCSATCGDGLLAVGAETCDDGDTAPFDGCGPSCQPEYGWSCGANPSGAPDSRCVASCGDGKLAIGAETCDDGNTAALDGCGPTCAPEPGWACVAVPGAAGTPASPESRCDATCGDGVLAVGAETCDDGDTEAGDGCAECRIERGWACPVVGAACVPVACGDGLRAVGGEACDDGNNAPGDGCDAACAIEPAWECATTAVDGDAAPDSLCTATCGDGERAEGAEGCDDGGLVPGDGCDGACGIEPGWSCAGAVGAASVCVEECGDGLIVGGEACDDGGLSDLDGCAGDCGAVESGWACEGEPSQCVTDCGDGLIGADVEVCDDGNAAAGDGCAADCAEVELGWSCGDPPAEPSRCQPLCGDGLVRGNEGCDDGDNDDGDGCSADCRVEAGWRCDLPPLDQPTWCVRDRDEDGVPDDGDLSGDPFDLPCADGQTEGCDDNCPDFPNPDQTFPTGDDASPLCPPYLGPVIHGGGAGCAGGGAGWPAGLALAALALGALLRRRRRSSAGVAVGLVLVALAPPGGAHAQSVDPRLFDAALSPTSILSVEASLPAAHLQPFGAIVASLANDELISQTGPDTWAHGPLHQRLVTTLAAGVGLFDRFDVALALPLIATGLGGDAQGTDGGVGDLRLALRGRIFGPAWREAGLGAAVLADLTFPTGSGAAFLSDGGVGLLARLVLDWRSADGLVVALNAGYRARPATAVGDITIADEIRLGLGAEIPVGTQGISLTAEGIAAIGLADNRLDGGGVAGREVPVELLGGLRWRAGSGLVLTAAAGAGVTGGYGAPDFRVLLGASVGAPAPAEHHEPLLPASYNAPRPFEDDAQTRLADAPLPERTVAPEAFDVLAAADPDADSDGVSLPGDQCPDEPEDRDGHLDSDGCPDPDNDGDGVMDVDDRCPDTQETVNGVDDGDGCPDAGESLVAQVGPQITISERIQFKSGGAELTERSEALLNQVALVIQAHPEIARIRIEGHTDSFGDREFNVDLAERRAWSVRGYLVERGVVAGRLFAKGFGSTRPVATNGTEAGRAKNRRVEFHVVAPGEPAEGEVQR